MNSRPDDRIAGLTLIELLIALGLLGILATMATSSFAELSAKLRISSSINDLVHILHLARQESWRSGNDVVLCKSRELSDCQANAEWQDGWVLFHNLDQDNPPHVDPGEIILRQGRAESGVEVSANRRAFVMRPFGLRSTNGTLVVCNPQARLSARAIVISYTGKPRITDTHSNGNTVHCALPQTS